MSFIVSARKYRPKKFSEVIGQDHIVTTIKNSITNGKIAHAYLFSGPRGVGKTTTARLIAKAINCETPDGFEPCGKCNSCVTFENSQTYDILELDAASNRRIEDIRALLETVKYPPTISRYKIYILELDAASNRRIEDIRALLETVKYPPTISRYKIYIIDEVHMLTIESFNALLKTLEEPPEYVIFIFATTDIHKVPATIKSRCQRFDFRRMEIEDIVKQLKIICQNENITADDKSLFLIAQKADGAMRDAESIFDQVATYCQSNITYEQLKEYFALIDEDILFKLIDAVINKFLQDVFEISQIVYDNGWNYNEFINETIAFLKNILEFKLTNKLNNLSTNYIDKFSEFSQKLSSVDILKMINFLNKSNYELKISQNQKILFDVILSNLILIERTATITELISLITTNNINLPSSSYGVIEEKQVTYNTSPKIENNNIQSQESKVTQKIDVVKPKNWETFLQELAKDQKILSDLLKKCNLKNFDKNKVIIELSGEVLLSDNQKKYLENKLNEFLESSVVVEIEENHIKQVIEDDDKVKFIKEKMGGSELFK